MRLLRLVASAMFMAASWAGPAFAQYTADEAPLKDWAVGILAADWRDGKGAPIEAFENARLALTEGFAAAGFDRGNISGLSLRPMKFGGDSLASEDVFALFEAKARSAQAGCLLYLTSHGVPEGIVLGNEGLLSPRRLDGLIDGWCGTRPTVVVVSACYSGVFLKALSAPNRMVMTAAQPDRSSFGCSADSEYPYFDGCMLESLPEADDFVHLASLAGQCVSAREQAEKLTPPSEPMSHVGADVETLLGVLNFERMAALPGEESVSLQTSP